MTGKYYCRSSSVAGRLVLNEAVLVRLPEGEMTVLNPSASVLWSLLDGTRTVEELESHLASRYSITGRLSVKSLLQELAERHLIVLLDGPDRPQIAPFPCPGIQPPWIQPAIRVQEQIHALAGPCGSSFTGQPLANCRADFDTCDDVTD